MSAQEKNRQALVSLLGSDALAYKLINTRLALVLPEDATPDSAVLLAKVLADALGRLWPNIDYMGEHAHVAMSAGQSAAESGGAPTEGHKFAWAPPYDLVISIGQMPPPSESPTLQVGANDWHVQFGEGASCGESRNPVGPAFAAGLAAAQVFSIRFASELAGEGCRSLDGWSTDVRALFHAQGLQCDAIHFDETHVFGVGAVTHGLAWMIEQWPRPVSGALHLVDGDPYGAGNGQRYAFMKPNSAGTSKVEAVAARLAKHPALSVTPHRVDMNTYCQERGYDKALLRIVAGLDSAEARRQAALKLPDSAINMWTSGSRIGAGQYIPGSQRGCLACAYPESMDSPKDEVGRLSDQTGLLPDLVRELLDSARPLTAAEAQKVSQAKGVSAEQIVGEPLRSVLPVLCATGKVPVNDAKEDVDVPFAFSSLLAGVAGFVMLLRDVQLRQEVSESWNQHVFKIPSPLMMKRDGLHDRCVRCNVVGLLELIP